MIIIPPEIEKDLDPDFVTDLYACFGPLPATYVGYRGVPPAGQQEALYQKHLADPSFDAAPPGHTAHEKHPTAVGVPRGGLALDYAKLETDGSHSFNYKTDPAWQEAWDAIKAAPALHSGHSFPEDTNGRVPCDDDHVESTAWFRVRSYLKQTGTWQL